jgi:serine/threonine-protein kinase
MIGRTLSHYEVLDKLGSGGMGVVYRARDPRLDRDVAVKVLPEEVATDPERLRRFQNEAKAAGALNHPNILAVHDVGTHEGRPYVVTELLEGATLRERMAESSLPVEKAVDYGVQIARGLAAAHDKGIVHRDIKPENLFVTRDGLVKILDFGLAKLRAPERRIEGLATDMETVSRTTDPGRVMGTVGYMSPEQVRGQAVDHRSDIFSFGTVLYEMLSGRRAFERDSGVEVLNAILKEEPPEIAATERGLPPHLDRILRRCLQKQPDERFHSARDLAFNLEAILTEPATAPSKAAPRKRRRMAYWVSGALVAGLLLGGSVIWALWRLAEPARPVVRMRMGVQPAEQLGGGDPTERGYLGLQRPSRTDLVFSPDGSFLVFTGVKDGQSQLYLRRITESEASPIPGTENALSPFFSPDGEWLGFWTGPDIQAKGEIKKVSMAGGLPVTVCGTGVAPFGASWGSDDTIVLGSQIGGLMRVSAEGGTPEELTKMEEGEFSHRLPHFLPDGEGVLFTVLKGYSSWTDAKILVQVTATGERRVLLEGAADARYVHTGHLVYAFEGTLTAVPFDPVRLEVTGGAVPMIQGLMQAIETPTGSTDTGAAQFSVSNSGTLAYLEGGVFPESKGSLVWVDRKGTAEPLGAPEKNYWNPRLSPDSRHVAVAVEVKDHTELCLFDISRRTLTPLMHEGVSGSPIWTPDGNWIVFGLISNGTGDLVRIAADGSGAAERLATSEVYPIPSSFTPDGKELVFLDWAPEASDIRVLPLDGGVGNPRPVIETRFYETHPALSPDGRWLAYASDESGRTEVYVQKYPGPGAKIRISIDGGQSPAWRGDGHELYFRSWEGVSITGGLPFGRIMAVDITTDPTLSAGRPRLLFEGPYEAVVFTRNYDVTPDGQRFLMVKPVEHPAQPVTHINVVLNWLEELERLVPTNR